jgi:hypothetical protein
MTTSLTRTLVAATFVLFAATACASASPQWTFAPASAPAEDAEESLPAASPNPALGDAAPPEASPGLSSGAPSESAAPAASAAPAGTSAPAASGAPSESAAPATSAAPDGQAQVVEIQATGALRFTTPDGEQVTDIPVTPGTRVVFRVDNTAGFDHNFHIGTDAELSVPNNADLPGIETWSSGVQEFEWEVPADVTSLKFGCTIQGHYALMQGTFSAAS